ncbi:hypothetical protein LTR56_015562 [Elasticomyces elasticus]|nr:hypothetical protein LTR56_015562 [Elasticomyces elasticus]KAK3648289.1 hypothetical protein LTR22_013420 [Elasticomyces elasticus]KAK4916279.1 hypothetical protein LTR49_015651 [Elasticomyces elasticus]KAK5764961.1 hypothetical protein LTS12_004989 [Elasticomyces elasticus]
MEAMHMGTPWLAQPVKLHSSRKYKCSVEKPEQCAWQQGYWRFWYEADHRFALPIVAFFLTPILLFTMGYLITLMATRTVSQSRPVKQLRALSRFCSYRTFRFGSLDWYSAPIGVLGLGAIGTILFFCMTLAPRPFYWPNTRTLNYGGSPPIATRTGWMSIACMPFVFATAAKSNWITLVTGVSHERLQVFHRWISYAMYVLALIHTFPFIIFHIWKGDMTKQWNTSVFYWTGVVALIAQTWLTFASITRIHPNAFGRLTSFARDYFIATGILFATSSLHRLLQALIPLGFSQKATFSLTENGFVSLEVLTKGEWDAGQHYFVRLLELQPWTAHPFSVSSLPEKFEAEQHSAHNRLVFLIQPRGGFTAQLAKMARADPTRTMRVILDGPYGGVNMKQFTESKRLVVVAGGSGVGWVLPLITAFQRRRTEPDEEQATMRVILAVRDVQTEHWVEGIVSKAQKVDAACPSRITVEIYNTRSCQDAVKRAAEEDGVKKERVDGKEGTQPGSVLAVSPDQDLVHARPNLPSIIAREAVSAASTPLGVFVCGLASMQYDISKEVARQQLVTVKTGCSDIYLHVEHFHWT